MVRTLNSKVTHHCWCGKTGRCRKHIARCPQHNVDYYDNGKCKHCIGEASAVDREEHKQRQEQRKQTEDAKRLEEESWYKEGKGRK